jgi:hypothetical protein
MEATATPPSTVNEAAAAAATMIVFLMCVSSRLWCRRLLRETIFLRGQMPDLVFLRRGVSLVVDGVGVWFGRGGREEREV